jgi:hypothetical protein
LLQGQSEAADVGLETVQLLRESGVLVLKDVNESFQRRDLLQEAGFLTLQGLHLGLDGQDLLRATIVLILNRVLKVGHVLRQQRTLVVEGL